MASPSVLVHRLVESFRQGQAYTPVTSEGVGILQIAYTLASLTFSTSLVIL